ncbi:MAG TPA: hypothetical protein VGY31_12355 [Terriglobia bacterium]|nr:hypothetical protein [Candidatus Acidoferrales bacterium]HEV2500363.1 hypothetical protein [Terriglobia bacterium]
MKADTSVAVRYWIATSRPGDFPDLDGIHDFRKELASHYVSIVKGRPTGAGGIARLYVEIISTLSLSHITQLLIDGIAFDLIKHGAKSFVLRPFLAAYRKLQRRNCKLFLDIVELQIEFQDCLLVIHETSSDAILNHLERILVTLAQNYSRLLLNNGERPFSIHIPVFEDPDADRPCRFRVIGDIDETIRSEGPADYFRFWGLVYDRARVVRVYDVMRQSMLDENFNTLERHWFEMNRRFRAKIKEPNP